MFFIHKGALLTDDWANDEYLKAKSFKEHAAMCNPLTKQKAILLARKNKTEGFDKKKII